MVRRPPLSHPRTGVGNYIRGSLAGLVEAAGTGTRSFPSRRPAHRGSAGSRRRSPASRWSRAFGFCPSRITGARPGAASGGRRSSGSWDRSTCCTSRTGCIRRSAAASARRWSTTSFRCGSRSGSRPARSGCTERSTGMRRTPAMFVRQPVFTKGEVVELLGVAQRWWSLPGCGDRGRGPAPISAAPTPHRGLFRAARNLETLLAAPLPAATRSPSSARKAGGRPSLDRPDVIRLGYVDDDGFGALPGAAALFTRRFRGVRHSIVEAMAAACRSSPPPTRRWTRPPATPQCVPT
jgi:hypothetical protein